MKSRGRPSQESRAAVVPWVPRNSGIQPRGGHRVVQPPNGTQVPGQGLPSTQDAGVGSRIPDRPPRASGAAAQPGRVPGAAAKVPFVPRGPRHLMPGQRPAPPPELDPEQAEEWRAIVDRMPPEWFPRESWPILSELVQDITLLKQVAVELNDVRKGSISKPDVFEKFIKLTRMKMQLQQCMGNLASKLRLTHRSRYDSKTAHHVEQHASRFPKPWDLGEEDNLVDREELRGPGGSLDRPSGEASAVAADRAGADLRQPSDDSAGDPQLRQEEWQNPASSAVDVGPFKWPAGPPKQSVVQHGAEQGAGRAHLPAGGQDGEDESDPQFSDRN